MDTFRFQVKEQPANINQNFHHGRQADLHQGRARSLISGTPDRVSIFRCDVLSFLEKKKTVKVHIIYLSLV